MICLLIHFTPHPPKKDGMYTFHPPKKGDVYTFHPPAHKRDVHHRKSNEGILRVRSGGGVMHTINRFYHGRDRVTRFYDKYARGRDGG